ncbi:DUF4296 domain-containing protein [Candidatus Cardinium hertigii]|jgi:hypothetical protein|uniref:DUF4296 domain-containing protein n=1 Tax=Candidatus Cardinium hertigii TaxID=247481 RepID=A0A3N2QDE2_9BACT|nr:DUF4296 domain-containing protein [Candidatus Cardinium hertigii]ROT47794.1 DUF4296 domain-containing protein [Candidatus Cardinium hertigii]
MKKTTRTLLTFVLSLVLSFLVTQPPSATPPLPPPAPPPPAPIIINDTIFVHIIRDMELLNSWIIDQDFSKETMEALRNQNYQKILALYEVDGASFKESTKYYLTDSVERALSIYKKVYSALEELLPPT